MDLCRYSNMFGEPRKKVHAPRLGGMAAVDLVGTIAIGVAYGAWRRSCAAALAAVVVLLIMSVCFHVLFCVDTPLTAAVVGKKRTARRSRAAQADREN